MTDVLLRMIDAIPTDRHLKFIDPISTGWVIIQVAITANHPEDPAYDEIASTMAHIIKSEPVLRAIPDLMACANEVLGANNLLTIPSTAARSLDAKITPIRKSQA